MDDLRSLIAGDEPAQATTARTMPPMKKTAGRGDPTKEQIFGRGDIAQHILQTQSMLRDAIPGSNLHKSLLSDLAVAQRETGMVNQPQAVQPQAIQPQQEAQPSSDPLRDLIAGTDATAPQIEKTVPTKTTITPPTKVNPQDIFNRPKTPEAYGNIRSVFSPENVTGAQETVRSLIQNPIVAAVGGIKGIFQSIPEAISKGEAPAPIASRIADEFTKKYGYSPTSEQGQKFASVISDVLESSKLPPIIPEIQAVASAGGAKPQLAKQFEKRANEIPTGNPLAKTAVTAAEMSPQDIASMQATFAAKRGGLTPSAPNAMGQSVGAAATAEATQLAELLTRASPEVQTAVKTITDAGHKIDPAGLKAIENHINFEEFGMKPTVGEATQNVAKLSDEYNSVKTDPEIAARLQERDPKLIEGFNKIKEEYAPEAYAPTQSERASAPLDTLKNKYVNRESNIRTAYQTLEDLNGGIFPVDAKTFSENAIAQLKKKNVYGATPKVLLDLLEKYAKEPMDFNGWDSARSVASEEMRKGGNEAKTGYIVRKALEDIPMTGEAATVLRPAADHARSLAKEQKDLLNPKSEKYNAAYTAAASDTRTAAEISLGVPHPASANFFEKHVIGKGTSEMQLRRTLDELAGNEAAIHELRAGTIHEAKTKSGIKDDKGSVSQDALNKFVSEQGNKLDIALGADAAAKLRRLSDVATKSEHVRKGGYANVSKTAIAQTPSPIKAAAKEIGTDLATLALTTSSPMAGAALALSKPFFKKRAEAKALKKLEAEQAAKSQETLAPGAGITYTPLSKIGK